MSVILILIIFSVIVAGGFLAAFLWSIRSGQFDDPYSSSVRILFDDEDPNRVQSEDGESAKKFDPTLNQQ